MERIEPKLLDSHSEAGEIVETVRFSASAFETKAVQLDWVKIKPNSIRGNNFNEACDDGKGIIRDAFGRRTGLVDYETGFIFALYTRYHWRDTWAWVRYWCWRLRLKALGVPTNPTTRKPYFSIPKKPMKDGKKGE